MKFVVGIIVLLFMVSLCWKVMWCGLMFVYEVDFVVVVRVFLCVL